MQMNRIEALPIIKDLRKGKAPKLHAIDLFVGQKAWFDAAITGVEETAECKSFEVRFIRARYGGGKTHFLRCLEAEAKKLNWVTAHVELKHKVVEMDNFITVVRAVTEGLDLPDGQIGFNSLLEKALLSIAGRYGYDPYSAMTMQVFEKARRGVEILCREKYLGFNFSIALMGAMQALLDKDSIRLHQIANWFCGGESIKIDPAGQTKTPGGSNTRATAVTLKPLALGEADQLIRIIAVLVLAAGCKGLFVGLDEIELIAGMRDKRRRENSFQTLRSLIDQNDPYRQPPATCLFLAATPYMFEDHDMFPKYKALQDRIEELAVLESERQINYSAPVINLDKTEPGTAELKQMSEKIVDIYKIAYGTAPTHIENRRDELISAIIKGGYVIARPRLFCRCMIDLLEGNLGVDLQKDLPKISKQIEDERKKEVESK